MHNYYELRPGGQQDSYGQDRGGIRLRLEPTERSINNNNVNTNISFDEDLYDGFIDSRMYSCLNMRSQHGAERAGCNFYDRNVIVAPAAKIRNDLPSLPSTSAQEPGRIRRKRHKHIQQKAYYPASDTDSGPSPEPSVASSPFAQKVPVYLYEHYDKKNKYLPKATRRVYKCKRQQQVMEDKSVCAASCTAPPKEERNFVDRCATDCDITFMKDPHPSTAKTSLASPSSRIEGVICEDCCEPETEPVCCEDEACCKDTQASFSGVEKELQAYYEEQLQKQQQLLEQQKLQLQKEQKSKQSSKLEDIQDERELKAVQLDLSRSSRKSRQMRPRSPPPLLSACYDTSSLKNENSSKIPAESDSSHVPTHDPSEQKIITSDEALVEATPSKSYHRRFPRLPRLRNRDRSRKSPGEGASRSKSSRASRRSRTRSKSKSKPTLLQSSSKTRSTSKLCTDDCEMLHKAISTERNRNLTMQNLPPIEVAPCDIVCEDCNNDVCLEKTAMDGTSPCICYQNGKPSSARYPTIKSPGYSSSKYYKGTRTGTNTRTYTTDYGTDYNPDYKYSSGYYSGTMRADRKLTAGYVCDSHTCGFGSNPIEVGYATTIVTRYSKYTVYEILRPSMKRPPLVCRVTENVFVVKNKFRQR